MNRDSLIAGGFFFVAAAAYLLRPAQIPPAAPAARAAKRVPADNSVPSSWTPETEPRVTFAHNMPHTQGGTQVINSSGTLNLGAVMVALPDGPKAVRFVRGSDPAARRYLEKTQAEQEKYLVNNGPSDLDLGEIVKAGPLTGSTKRRVRNLKPDTK